MPLPDVEVTIVDSDTGEQELRAHDIGEIVISAPQLMAGYWQNPGETALVLRSRGDGRRWLYTGDLGYLDSDGYLFIVDRKKDLIKTSGYQVWPREVEEVLASHPAIAEPWPPNDNLRRAFTDKHRYEQASRCCYRSRLDYRSRTGRCTVLAASRQRGERDSPDHLLRCLAVRVSRRRRSRVRGAVRPDRD
jgi:acyl-CoA synthetase (AMP-forming)/AMP-acid ligase II